MHTDLYTVPPDFSVPFQNLDVPNLVSTSGVPEVVGLHSHLRFPADPFSDELFLDLFNPSALYNSIPAATLSPHVFDETLFDIGDFLGIEVPVPADFATNRMPEASSANNILNDLPTVLQPRNEASRVQKPAQRKSKPAMRRPSSRTSSPHTPTFNLVQYTLDKHSGQFGSSKVILDGPARQRGRKGPLSPTSKHSAAKMRTIKACEHCNRRKQKCDEGAPCKPCVLYYKTELIHNPCRGMVLANLSSVLLSDTVPWHPAARTIASFLSSTDYVVRPQEYTVYINLGFGTLFPRKVRAVFPVQKNELFHAHTVYAWPPKPRMEEAINIQTHVVLPAVLADESDLTECLDEQLGILVDNDFESFPLYKSEFHILYEIYRLYLSLEGARRTMLGQALKLLVLTHIGGDAMVDVSDYGVQAILTAVLPENAPRTSPGNVTPCFIRGQLGAAMPGLAQKLLRDVLSELEVLALSRACGNWPVILSTLATLFMTIETIQYHSSKAGMHTMYDKGFVGPPLPQQLRGLEKSAALCQKVDTEAAETLLKFYENCYGGCHAQIHGADVVVRNPSRSDRHNGTYNRSTFLSGLKTAVNRAQQYLEERSQVQIEKLNDMSCFFDRLLAKLFLLKT